MNKLITTAVLSVMLASPAMAGNGIIKKMQNAIRISIVGCATAVTLMAGGGCGGNAAVAVLAVTALNGSNSSSAPSIR